MPLYVDDAVSEDSRRLVEEHLKECPSCRTMLEEIKKENQLHVAIDEKQEHLEKSAEIQPLKKIRKCIRRKRILAVCLAAVLVFAACSAGHYWYYDRETFLSWQDAGLTAKDDKVYMKINPEGRIRAILSVDQKNMFYILSETGWTRKEYPTEKDKTYKIFDLREFQKAHDRGPDETTDETSLPTGLEHVYCVEPADIKEAEKLWNYADDSDEAQKKEEELAAKCTLIWSAQ